MAGHGRARQDKTRQGFLNAHTHLQRAAGTYGDHPLLTEGDLSEAGKKMHLNSATGVLQLTPTEYDSMLQHRAELLAAKIAETVQRQAKVEAGRKELLNALYAHNARLNGGKYKEVNGYAVVSWDTDKLTMSKMRVGRG